MSSTSGAIQVMEFVRALALAWKNLAVYPPGHPTLRASLETVNARLAELRGPAGEVTLGIAADGLIYGSAKIDSSAAQKLAQALHARGVAILQLSSETTESDVASFLRVLATAGAIEQKRRIWEELTAAGVVNINLQPVSYAVLQTTDELEERAPDRDAGSLWEEVLRALLEHHKFADGSAAGARVSSADELARMISEIVDSEPGNASFDPEATFGIRLATAERPDDRFVGYLTTTVGRQITQAISSRRPHALEQAVQLLRSLPERVRATILRGVVGALAGEETAPSLLRDLNAAIESDEVLDALRYLASIGKLSGHGLSLLEALSTVEASSRPVSPGDRLITDLVVLLGEDDIDRFNPSTHQQTLGNIAIEIPRVPAEAMSAMTLATNGGDSVEASQVLEQLTQVLFELIEELGPTRPPQAVLQRLEAACRGLLAAGRFRDSSAIIERLQGLRVSASEPRLIGAIDESLARLCAPETIQALVAKVMTTASDKAHELRKLVGILGSPARRNLLLALAEEGNRSRRRRLFDFITSLGQDIVPEVKSLLGDERWYVLRNMILILRAVDDRSSANELRQLTMHPDPRVKLEAIRSVVAINQTVPRDLLEGLFRDPDPKVTESAMTLVGHYRMKEGVGPLLQILGGNDVLGTRRTLRVTAIRTLGEIGDASALGTLERFFTTSMLPWPSREERIAAWESLARYPDEARERYVEKGLRSSDTYVRNVCERLRTR